MAESRLITTDAVSTVFQFGHVSGEHYADKAFAVRSIENRCRDRPQTNNAQAEFISFLGGRMSAEDFAKMCRRALDRERQVREIDRELLKTGIVLGDVRPKTAPPFGDISGDPKLVNNGTAVGFDIGTTDVTVTRGPGTGLEPGAENFFVQDKWEFKKWSANIGIRDEEFGPQPAPVKTWIGVGAGFDLLARDVIQLNGFNQFLKTGTAEYAALEFGIEKRLSGHLNLIGSFTLQRNAVDIKSLGNNPPAVGSLPLGGDIETWSLAPRIGLSYDVVRNGKTRMVPWAMVGAGVAFQDLNATNSGATVLSGNKTTAMVTFAGGIKFPVNERVSVGVNGFVNWFDGFNVSAGPGVNAAMASRTEVGGYISLDIKNPFGTGY
ncbi:MAG: hypothetical protein NXI27_17140 [Alphaproteobacteria bacterium]|nr:hypothetical protein [Alphaproteobacteria bacterium]